MYVGERSPAAGRLSGGPGPTLNEQSTCAEVAAWLVITSDRRSACVWSASAGTLLPAVRHQVRVWRPPRHRWKALDELLSVVPTATARRVVGAVRGRQ